VYEVCGTSTIDVNDILEVLAQNNFSNQKQIELLHVVNYALHKKHYPQDTCGIIERKIKLLEQSEQETACAGSNLQLSAKKGFKVNFIRVINCLCELNFFSDKRGGDMTKIEIFQTFGNTINQDLSYFQNNMNASYQAANADMESTLAIFKDMLKKQIEINNSKTEKKYRK
jgi:hypothetical protein